MQTGLGKSVEKKNLYVIMGDNKDIRGIYDGK